MLDCFSAKLTPQGSHVLSNRKLNHTSDVIGQISRLLWTALHFNQWKQVWRTQSDLMLQDLVLHTKIHTFIIQKIELVSVTNSSDNNSSSEVKCVNSNSIKICTKKISWNIEKQRNMQSNNHFPPCYLTIFCWTGCQLLLTRPDAGK